MNDAWDIEPSPSERDDRWIAGHRFYRDTALSLARRHAPRIQVNGKSGQDVMATVEHYATTLLAQLGYPGGLPSGERPLWDFQQFPQSRMRSVQLQCGCVEFSIDNI